MNGTSRAITRLLCLLLIALASVPVSALHQCLSGDCPMPCCIAARSSTPDADVDVSPPAKKKGCCPSKAEQTLAASQRDRCDSCSCSLQAGTSLPVADDTALPWVAPWVVGSLSAPLTVPPVRACDHEPGIYGCDSGPPKDPSGSEHFGRAPPVSR